MTDNSNANAIVSYNYQSQTVRITRGDKTRFYFMNRAMSVCSFVRLWKLAYDVVPRSLLINESDGFMFFWYRADIPLDWTWITLDKRTLDYWWTYDAINHAANQKTRANAKLAHKLALMAYGWTESDYHDAYLTAMEIAANTQ